MWTHVIDHLFKIRCKIIHKLELCWTKSPFVFMAKVCALIIHPVSNTVKLSVGIGYPSRRFVFYVEHNTTHTFCLFFRGKALFYTNNITYSNIIIINSCGLEIEVAFHLL